VNIRANSRESRQISLCFTGKTAALEAEGRPVFRQTMAPMRLFYGGRLFVPES
jgi:hypothetical protein